MSDALTARDNGPERGAGDPVIIGVILVAVSECSVSVETASASAPSVATAATTYSVTSTGRRITLRGWR